MTHHNIEEKKKKMSITAEQKKSVIEKFRTAESDTGSPEVQVALLSTRIKNLTEHLKAHSKDFHTRRGLLKLVGQRKNLLGYLKSRSIERYNKLIQDLGLRR
jgi:small subunit ribosomal protein S15